MDDSCLKTLSVGTGLAARPIAVRARSGAGPGLFWLGGFKSDMRGSKAEALDAWAGRNGRAMVRFDYSGHGESGGTFTEGTIGQGSTGGPSLAGLVLIAPAVDFTEELMWKRMPPAIQKQIADTGVWMRPSAYDEGGYPITRTLIEEGRNHLLLGGMIETGCPVRILQGVRDEDVPWQHAVELTSRFARDDVVLTLVKDGDHRLSRPEDIERLIAAVAEF